MNQLLTPHFPDYELIDSGDFEKLERFGEFTTRRPEPQAIWHKSLSEEEWQRLSDASFLRTSASKSDERGEWHNKPRMKERWWISYDYKQMHLKMRLGLTSFKHVGIFPEQGANWNYIYDCIERLKADGSTPKVLNLFAYTGGATLAARSAGADVTHVDSVKQVVSWARENMEQSGLDGVRWIVEDALAAHCVHISDEDIKILADRGVSVAANPKSNMKLGNGFAPIKKLLDSGVNVCIGTDSAASNNSLNMFSDMNFTALVHKGTGEDAQAVSAVEVHRMATENGAAALGINAGKIEKGMLADIILLDLNTPQFNPRNNLVAAMSYSATGSETDTVIIDGKIVMRDKKLLTIDEEKLYYEANKIMERLRKEG